MYHSSAFAQDKTPYVRIAKIVVDSSQLESYKAALKEHAETAVRVEPGVQSLYAVYDKENPTHVTVFEIYASKAAYELHIQTPHFKKYKTSTQNMVKHLNSQMLSPLRLQQNLNNNLAIATLLKKKGT